MLDLYYFIFHIKEKWGRVPYLFNFSHLVSIYINMTQTQVDYIPQNYTVYMTTKNNKKSLNQVNVHNDMGVNFKITMYMYVVSGYTSS